MNNIVYEDYFQYCKGNLRKKMYSKYTDKNT